jgi:hypothetical protein
MTSSCFIHFESCFIIFDHGYLPFLNQARTMGQQLSCTCLEQALGMEDKEFLERIQNLKNGHKFMRNAFLGMSQREIFVQMTEDMTTLQWKAAKTALLSEEKGEIDVTALKQVKCLGISTIQFIGSSDKSVFDINSDDPKIRDLWVGLFFKT